MSVKKNIYWQQDNYEIIKTPVIYSVSGENHRSWTPPQASLLGLIGASTRLRSVSEVGFDEVLHVSCPQTRFFKDVLNEITVFAVPWTP